MIRSRLFPVMAVLLLVSAIGQAQSPAPPSPPAPQPPGQRSGGQRGASNELLQRFRLVSPTLQPAWWTNANLVARLGLTDDQKTKIEHAYENHRQSLMTATEQLDKEEAQLSKLLDAETIDRNATLSQIDRVTQARAEVERQNSAMTLEMREVLTAAQWRQLQLPVWFEPYRRTIVNPTPGLRGGGGRGQRQ